MRFAEPWWLVLLAPLLASAVYAWSVGGRRRTRIALTHSLAGELKKLPHGPRARLARFPLILRTLALAALIVGLARPQGGLSRETFETEGIDIILVLDVSGSMQADDLEPNRLFAARAVAADFVTGRPHDQIGFVTFATTAVSRVPLTLDHAALAQIISQTSFSQEGQTAIGTALATAVNRLRDSEGEGRVVILLTDGRNNAGEIDPPTAAEIAKSLGIKVYTIGVGMRPENVPMMRRLFRGVPEPVDEEQLRQIAQATGGRYYRAEDADTLKHIYEEISRLETRPIEAGVIREYKEAFVGWVLLALALTLAEFVLRRSYLQDVVHE